MYFLPVFNSSPSRIKVTLIPCSHLYGDGSKACGCSTDQRGIRFGQICEYVLGAVSVDTCRLGSPCKEDGYFYKFECGIFYCVK